MRPCRPTWPTIQRIDLVALCGHTISLAGRVRVRLQDGAAIMHDSGWVAAWPSRPSLELAYEDRNFWHGTLTSEDVAGLPAYTLVPIPRARADSLIIDVDDPHHPAGVIAIGAVVCGPAWSPRWNHGPGWRMRLTGDPPAVRRELTLTLEDLAPVEVHGSLMPLLLRQQAAVEPHAGTLAVLDLDASASARHQTAFLGRVTARPAVGGRHAQARRSTLTIMEVL